MTPYINTFFHSSTKETEYYLLKLDMRLPFVVHTARFPYAGKSFIIPMRIALKLKYVLLTIS